LLRCVQHGLAVQADAAMAAVRGHRPVAAGVGAPRWGLMCVFECACLHVRACMRVRAWARSCHVCLT